VSLVANEASVSNFQITPSQYQLFNFTVERPTTLRIRMIATAPVNLILLNSEDRASYEPGQTDTRSYKTSWGRRSDIDAEVRVKPGTWYLAVEGSMEPSKGRIEVLKRNFQE